LLLFYFCFRSFFRFPFPVSGRYCHFHDGSHVGGIMLTIESWPLNPTPSPSNREVSESGRSVDKKASNQSRGPGHLTWTTQPRNPPQSGHNETPSLGCSQQPAERHCPGPHQMPLRRANGAILIGSSVSNSLSPQQHPLVIFPVFPLPVISKPLPSPALRALAFFKSFAGRLRLSRTGGASPTLGTPRLNLHPPT
jgi:hypothetical protein